MLYYLFEWLHKLNFPGAGMFGYTSFRAYIKSSGEHKSKPTQHSVKELRSLGINPDIIVLRCDEGPTYV